MAEDVPENHVVSEDVGMLTGVAELNEKSGNPQSHAIRYTQETPTEYNSKRPGTQRKAKAHKKPKKREEDVAEDVAEVTWLAMSTVRSNVNGIMHEKKWQPPVARNPLHPGNSYRIQ